MYEDDDVVNLSRDNYVSYMGSTHGSTFKDMKVYRGAGYIDVYLAPGTYTLATGDNVTAEITEETTITSMSGSVYRLVFESNEAAASSEE